MKRLLMNSGKIALFIFAISFISQPPSIFAQDLTEECVIVRIQDKEVTGTTEGAPAGLRLDPDVLKIKRGTCVVWLNWANYPEVAILISEGKRCADVTEAQEDFTLTDAPPYCFAAKLAGIGQTASLRFMETGIFNYTVESAQKMKTTTGRIIVE